MKITYLTIFAVTLVSFSVKNSYAQNAGIYINDVSGFPIRPGAVASDISGSSYLNREWQLGTVTGKSGKIYKTIPARGGIQACVFPRPSVLSGFGLNLFSISCPRSLSGPRFGCRNTGGSTADLPCSTFLKTIIGFPGGQEAD